MKSRKEYEKARQQALKYFDRAHIILREEEKENMEIADMGLGRLEEIGLQLVTYVNTDRHCAKEMVLFPGQTCPEHRHPPIGDKPGKEETFRCRWGKVWLYVDGEPTFDPHCQPPKENEEYYTAWHEVELNPGDQYTIDPDVKHWFQAGAKGAVISEFSTSSRDEKDIFTNPAIKRVSKGK